MSSISVNAEYVTNYSTEQIVSESKQMESDFFRKYIILLYNMYVLCIFNL